jgi:hypothetical protein
MREFETWKEAKTGLQKIRKLGGSVVHEIPPGTLAEVMDDLRRGQAYSYAINGFLIEFDTDTDDDSRRKRIEDEPSLAPNPVLNALFGAAAEYLSQRCNLGEAPAWSRRPERYLSEPCFLSMYMPKSDAFRQSPPAFRRRGLYTHDKPMQCTRDTLSLWSFEHIEIDRETGMRMGL